MSSKKKENKEGKKKGVKKQRVTNPHNRKRLPESDEDENFSNVQVGEERRISGRTRSRLQI